mgnify:CR=1 FL=1
MNRILSFDIAKAVALLAVMFGHCAFAGAPTSLVDFCYSFHMPLFFIVSGYFCSESARVDADYVRKNARTLLVPYLVTCIVIILGGALLALLTGSNPLDEALKWTIAGLYGAGGVHPGMPAGVIGIGAIWFLWALFWGRLLLAEIDHMPHPFVISCALFVVGVSTTGIVWLPLGLQNALCAVLFLHVGQYLRKTDLVHRMGPMLWTCAAATWLYCGAFCGHLYMEGNSFGNGLLDVIGGICGTLCLLRIAEALERRVPRAARVVARIGQLSLPLFCMHLVILNLAPWDRLIAICNSANVSEWPVALATIMAGSVALTALLRLVLPKRVASCMFR